MACKLIDERILSTARVQNYLSKRYVNVKLDAIKPETQELVKKYNLRGLPLFMMFTSSGKLHGFNLFKGEINDDVFLDVVKKLAKGNLAKPVVKEKKFKKS